MASLSYNSYIFTNVQKWQVDSNDEYTYKGVLVASKLSQKNGQDYKLIDAIDIDWDKAWIPSLKSYVNTSEDLLNILDSLNQNDTIDDLLKKLQELEMILNDVVVAYVSHIELRETLKNYQRKLTAGPHIDIDSYSNISAYGFVTPEELYETTLSYVTKTELYTYYYDKYETEVVAEEAAAYAVAQVVDGADPAFDTLKEIADWILDQDKYTLVTDLEILEQITQAAINGEEHEKLYHRNEKGGFVEVEDYTELDTTGETEYYTRKSLLDDFRELEKRYYELENTVGYALEDNGVITYTGLRWEIDENRLTAREALGKAEYAVETADIAYAKAEYAINVAEMAYDTANNAIVTAYEALDEADIAYIVAVKASYDVGIPSEEAHYELANIDYIVDEITYYVNTNNTPETAIYEIKEDGAYYLVNYNDYIEYSSAYAKFIVNQEKIQELYDNADNYYVWQDAVEATGLTKRVEDVEKKIKTIEENVEDNNALLYYLDVDNSYSDYVKLGFKEYEFQGDKHRTLTIQHDTAYIDAYEGIVTYDGIPNMETISDCFTYVSTWKIFPCTNPGMHTLPSLDEKYESIKNGTLIINYYTPIVKFKDTNNIEITNVIDIYAESYEMHKSFDINIMSNTEFKLIVTNPNTNKWIAQCYIIHNDETYVNNDIMPILDNETASINIDFISNLSVYIREDNITITAINPANDKELAKIIVCLHQSNNIE